MNDCTTCRFESDLIICLQGHSRLINYDLKNMCQGYIPIQYCHAWQEKEREKCECKNYPLGTPPILNLFSLTCKKCRRVYE